MCAPQTPSLSIFFFFFFFSSVRYPKLNHFAEYSRGCVFFGPSRAAQQSSPRKIEAHLPPLGERQKTTRYTERGFTSLRARVYFSLFRMSGTRIRLLSCGDWRLFDFPENGISRWVGEILIARRERGTPPRSSSSSARKSNEDDGKKERGGKLLSARFFFNLSFSLSLSSRARVCVPPSFQRERVCSLLFLWIFRLLRCTFSKKN
jgi:hypothetical protein